MWVWGAGDVTDLTQERVDRVASELFLWVYDRMIETRIAPEMPSTFEAASEYIKDDVRGIVRCVLLADRS